MKKTLFYALISVAVISFFGITAVAVQANTEGNFPPIVQKLVERFNLNADEVQEVFNEVREENKQGMKDRFNGYQQDLTDEQKEALQARREEMQQEMEALKDLSSEERQAKMQEIQSEMKAWAEENGYEGFMMMGMGMRGGHNDFNKGFRPSESE